MTNEDLEQLERRINELKTLYDNYFTGVEKREPLQKRTALLNDMRRLTANPGQLNTQTQFRFNNIRSRFATMESHWNRLVKQLEEGLTKRKRPSAEEIGAAPPAPAAVAKKVAAAPAPPNPLADATMRKLYDSYAASRAQTGEQNVSYDAMVASLKKQVPAVIDRYKCKSVEFKVSQKEGRTIIKAVPIT
jgi:hypothetical protein